MGVRATRLRRLRIRKAIGHATLGVGLLAAGMLYVAIEKNVTLVVDGQPEAIRTMSGNVGQLLTSQGIVLSSGDVVQPPLQTSLADGMTIVVDLAEAAVLAQEDLEGVGVWVVDGVSGPFVKLVAQPTESILSADAVGPSRIVDARVVVKGKEHDVLTNATTVRELLSAMGITPDDDDRVQPSPSTPLHAGQLIRYVDIELRTRRVQVTIPFATDVIYTDALEPGEVDFLRAGSTGTMIRTYEIKIVDGKVVAKKLVSQRVTRAPISARRRAGIRDANASGSAVGDAVWYEAPGSGFTAAHLTLPFGTRVTVTNLDNGRSVTVVITDRGPYGGRLIDLSPEAFEKIAPLGQGVARVRITW
ncbi:MAG: ubiquitin-like domain-containing protein [Actinomycetota bacterium]